jgi:hypothetical protein
MLVFSHPAEARRTTLARITSLYCDVYLPVIAPRYAFSSEESTILNGLVLGTISLLSSLGIVP